MDVLVVEDECLLRELVVDVLSDAGLDVTGTGSAEEALALASAIGLPRAVVTDINLGAGMSGLDLADAMRARAPRVCIMFITGRPENLLDRPPGPLEGRMFKPFDLASLVLTVSRWTQASRCEGAKRIG